ncbi:CidA/LrgA family protein [Viridibacillus sp. YIM B01967]|uniref:CidA/LrgA family protein n=2 Tax=Viridibacillus soli TaxID=2798301 RepID=A0ABS1H8R6_9BACL|nr:CidA/LrgA family protein [Viridibacillus soli]
MAIQELQTQELDVQEQNRKESHVKDSNQRKVDSKSFKQKIFAQFNSVKTQLVKYVRIILQIAVLYFFSFLGTYVVDLLGINFPGSIAGLLILLTLLLCKVIPVTFIENGAGFMLAILPLFFVPATVGIINYPELISLHGLLLLLSVIVSTIFTIFVSGKICQYIESKEMAKHEEVAEVIK